MLRSMTGFGRASGTIGNRFQLAVTARSVNHRYLEVSIRLPEWMWEFETTVRAIAGEMLSRGKVDITLRAQRISEPEYAVRVNRGIADTVVPQLRTILEELGSSSTFAAADLLRIPDLLQVEPVEQELEQQEKDDVARVVREAVFRLREMRITEAEGLRRDIETRLEWVEKQRAELAAARDELAREAVEAYRQRVAEITKTAELAVSEDRLAQETAVLLEKMDVSEEVTRLGIHVEQMRQMLDGTEPAGKKLDFLTQELLREVNTLGQKSRASSVRSVVVELKAEIERIREQVQNVE
jgi:uncharacterized protein (TIGR00255 family)